MGLSVLKTESRVDRYDNVCLKRFVVKHTGQRCLNHHEGLVAIDSGGREKLILLLCSLSQRLVDELFPAASHNLGSEQVCHLTHAADRYPPRTVLLVPGRSPQYPHPPPGFLSPDADRTKRNPSFSPLVGFEFPLCGCQRDGYKLNRSFSGIILLELCGCRISALPFS